MSVTYCPSHTVRHILSVTYCPSHTVRHILSVTTNKFFVKVVNPFSQVWRVKYTLAKIRKAARDLLTLEEKDPRRLFEGNAILRRLVRIGVLDENRMKLDYVLGKFLKFYYSRHVQYRPSQYRLPNTAAHFQVPYKGFVGYNITPKTADFRIPGIPQLFRQSRDRRYWGGAGGGGGRLYIRHNSYTTFLLFAHTTMTMSDFHCFEKKAALF